MKVVPDGIEGALSIRAVSSGDPRGVAPLLTDRATFTAEDLRRLRIGFIVYHRDRPLPEVPTHVQALGLPVAADDGTVTVWEVPQAAGPSGRAHG